MKETWKPIPGLRGYLVSNMGNLRRLYNRYRWESGVYQGYLAPDGYRVVGISVNRVRRFLRVHRLVCLAFLGEVPLDCEVNHKNGVKSDNRLSNLEYVTRKENILHAIRTGLFVPRKGEEHPSAKLQDGDILKIFGMRRDGFSVKKISRSFHCTANYVYKILGRQARKEVAI